MTNKNELVRELAKIVEGLAVPYSIDRAMIGTAGEPWKNVRDILNLFGYPSFEEIEKGIIEKLGENNGN